MTLESANIKDASALFLCYFYNERGDKMDWISFLEKRYQQNLHILIYMKENKFTLHELAKHFHWHQKTLKKKLMAIDYAYPQVTLCQNNKIFYWQYQNGASIHQIFADTFSKSALFSMLYQAAWGISEHSEFTHHQYNQLNHTLFSFGFFIQENERLLLGNEGAIRKFLFEFARDFPHLCPKDIQATLSKSTTNSFELSERLMTKIIFFRQAFDSPSLPKLCWVLAKKAPHFSLFQADHSSLRLEECLYLYFFLHSDESINFPNPIFPYTLEDIYPVFPEMKQWFLLIQHVFPEFSDLHKQSFLTIALLQRLICRALYTNTFLTDYEKEKIYQKLLNHPKMLHRLEKVSERQPHFFTKNTEDKKSQVIYNYQMIATILSSQEIEMPIHICLLLKQSENNLKSLQQAIQHHFSLFHAVRVSIHLGNKVPSYADICVTDYFILENSSKKKLTTIFSSSLFFEELILELTSVILQLEKNRQRKNKKILNHTDKL